MEASGSFLINWRYLNAVVSWRPFARRSKPWYLEVRSAVNWPATLRARSLTYRITWRSLT